MQSAQRENVTTCRHLPLQLGPNRHFIEPEARSSLLPSTSSLNALSYRFAIVPSYQFEQEVSKFWGSYQVAAAYDRWIAKAQGDEWEAFRQKLNGPGLYRGQGVCPKDPMLAARLFSGAASSNLDLEQFQCPPNWVIWNRDGGIDSVFHTESALQH
jgi:hypothetical protein